MAWIMLASAVIGAAGTAAKQAPAGPSYATSPGTVTNATPWNADGWIVTTGGSKADVSQKFGDKGTSAKSDASTPLDVIGGQDPVSTALGLGGNNTLILIAAVALAVVLIKRKKA